MIKNISILDFTSPLHKEAAEKYFGKKMKIISCKSSDELFRVTESNYSIHAAIIPIENSNSETIAHHYRLMHKSSLKITGEVYEGSENNYNRYFVLQRSNNKNNYEANKASLYFETDHYKGNLARVLSIIAKANVNLTGLRSRFVQDRLWSFGFYADMEFDSLDDFNIAVDRMKEAAEQIFIYGTYKKATIPF